MMWLSMLSPRRRKWRDEVKKTKTNKYLMAVSNHLILFEDLTRVYSHSNVIDISIWASNHLINGVEGTLDVIRSLNWRIYVDKYLIRNEIVGLRSICISFSAQNSFVFIIISSHCSHSLHDTTCTSAQHNHTTEYSIESRITGTCIFYEINDNGNANDYTTDHNHQIHLFATN